MDCITTMDLFPLVLRYLTDKELLVVSGVCREWRRLVWLTILSGKYTHTIPNQRYLDWGIFHFRASSSDYNYNRPLASRRGSTAWIGAPKYCKPWVTHLRMSAWAVNQLKWWLRRRSWRKRLSVLVIEMQDVNSLYEYNVLVDSIDLFDVVVDAVQVDLRIRVKLGPSVRVVDCLFTDYTDWSTLNPEHLRLGLNSITDLPKLNKFLASYKRLKSIWIVIGGTNAVSTLYTLNLPDTVRFIKVVTTGYDTPGWGWGTREIMQPVPGWGEEWTIPAISTIVLNTSSLTTVDITSSSVHIPGAKTINNLVLNDSYLKCSTVVIKKSKLIKSRIDIGAVTTIHSM